MLITEMYGTQIPAPLHTHSSMHLVSSPLPDRVFSNENILPLLAVITSPEIHTISMFMRLGSLYHVLHDLDSGEPSKTYTHTIVFILRESVERITYLCYCHDLHVCVVNEACVWHSRGKREFWFAEF